MASLGGFNFTTFSGVNLRNTAALRFVGDGTTDSTLSIRQSLDTSRAWNFPDKSGTFGVTGTFTVNLPSVASAGYLSTVVTVTGIRVEDAVIVTPQSTGGGAVVSARGALAIVDAVPGNGNITILFANVFATATTARDNIYAYTTVR